MTSVTALKTHEELLTYSEVPPEFGIARSVTPLRVAGDKFGVLRQSPDLSGRRRRFESSVRVG